MNGPNLYGMIEDGHIPILEKAMLPYQQGNAISVGCGTEIVHQESLAHLVKELVGVDSDYCAQKVLSNHKIPNFKFMKGDATALPFDSGMLDVVTVFGVYGLIVNDFFQMKFETCNTYNGNDIRRVNEIMRYEFIGEMARVIKKEGILILSNHTETTPPDRVTEELSEFFNVYEIHNGIERYLMIASRNSVPAQINGRVPYHKHVKPEKWQELLVKWGKQNVF